MLKLAFSSNAFKKTTLTEAVESIAHAGYRGVEIMADLPHAYPPQFGQAQRQALCQQLRRLRIRASNVNAFTLFAAGDTYHPTWIEADPAQRQCRIDHTLTAVDLAADIGAPTVSLQPGGPLIGTGLSREDAGRRFAEGLGAVLPRARQRKVTLAIEPEPGLFLQSSAEYLAFKQQFFADEPLLKMNCDLGHLFCVGDDPAEVLRTMPQEIAHIHLEDIGKNHVHQHLPLGKGNMDIAAILKTIKTSSYHGWVTVELYPYVATAGEVAQKAMEYLKKH